MEPTEGCEEECNAIVKAIKQALGKALKDASGTDKTPLKSMIDTVQATLDSIPVSVDGKDVAEGKYWVTREEWNELKAALVQAKENYEKDLTPDLVQREVTKLLSALKTFEQKRKTGVIETETKFKDGVYDVSSRGFLNGQNRFKVTIRDGKVAGVEIVEWTDSPGFDRKMDVLIERIVENNSTDVDAVSGATNSSNSLKEAVRKALIEAGNAVSPTVDEEVATLKREIRDLVFGTKQILYDTKDRQASDREFRQRVIAAIKVREAQGSIGFEKSELSECKEALADMAKELRGRK